MTTDVTHLCLRPCGQSTTELTAAGLLTLGGPMVGAPGDDLDLLCLLSLSLGCACMICWAYETRERFAKEGKRANRKGRRFPKLVVRRAPLLRLLLLLGRAADDASDDVGCVCFPPTHRVYPVRLCHSWCWLRGCRSCWFIRSIQAFNNDHKGPWIL